MTITLELLNRLGAKDKYVQYFKAVYGDSAKLSDILTNPHFDLGFLHWCCEHFDMTENERALYCQACEITKSSSYWCSSKVANSSQIIQSTEITDSEFIFHSKKITGSAEVFNSEYITESKNIYNSSIVEKSKQVYKSFNIIQSENIVGSTMILNSNNIFESSNIFDSSEIIKSSMVSNSSFCQECEDIKFCLFCDGLKGAEYHLFNKPIDKRLFDIFVKQYADYFVGDLSFFIPSSASSFSLDHIPYVTRNPQKWYAEVSNFFWKWMKTLPGYDQMLIYNMTMLPKILLD